LTRDNAPVALKPSSYVILGLVRGGLTSGYAIKQFVNQQRMENFWATTFAQIYPELAHLEEAGHLTSTDNPHGGRQRRAYVLTDAGESALQAWLRRDRIPKRELRDEGLLRLAFADHLPRENAIELVSRLRARSEEALREFREEVLPLGETLRDAGARFPVEICRLGAEYHELAIEHFSRLEAELRESAANGAPRHVEVSLLRNAPGSAFMSGRGETGRREHDGRGDGRDGADGGDG
jgi:DNA-binding PadR family transcriptional regulator